jgi:cysteine-S-conjugate beta-lyase
MKYNFDEIIPRENTNSVKYDYRKGYFGTEDVIPLWVADMDFRTPDFIINTIKNRANHEIFGYSLKPDSFYDSVIHWVKKRHNWNIKKDWISFSPGVVPALAMCVLTFSNPGDKVILQSPVYHPFFSTIKNNGRQILNNPLKFENGYYTMDFEDLEKKIDSQARMLLLSSPHNPVGRVWNKKELEQLGNICVKHNLIIIADEIHSDLILKKYSHTPLASITEEIAKLTITAIAPSKTFNVAGLSSSALIIPNKDLIIKFNRTLDNLHVGMGNIFGIAGMEAAYTNGEEWLEQLLDYLQDNYNFVKEFIHQRIPKIKVIPLEGTYLLWLDFRECGIEQLKVREFLISKAKVGFNDGASFGYGGSGFQRMNIASPRKILEEALLRIESAFKEIS